jgi:hypothetical protein
LAKEVDFCEPQRISKYRKVLAVYKVLKDDQGITMQHQEVHIPSFMRSFLGDVNTYYEALPETFQSELKSYMYHIAWAVNEDLPIDDPDDKFAFIKDRFDAARRRLMN